MTSLRRALWGLGAAGVAFGLIDVAFAVTSDHVMAPGLFAALGLVVGWGFVGVGLFAWGLRPENRIGSLMTASGFAWFLAMLSLSNIPLLFTIGNALGAIFLATAVHMLMSIPTGRLQTRGDRRIVAIAYLLSTVLIPPVLLFADPVEDFSCPECPENLLLVSDNDTAVTVLTAAVNVVAAGLVIAVLVSLVRRWRRSEGSERRLFGPVYAAGVLLMIGLIVTAGLSVAFGDKSDELDLLSLAAMVPVALVPYLMLASFIRARIVQGGAVGQLVARLGEAPQPGGLRDALADALGDPSLELVYWLPEDERFVDAEGRPYELPEDGASRAATKVERDGGCIAAIVYDTTLPMAGEHAGAVGAAAALALANERLDAELRAKVKELRASRERMLGIALEERRRLERDLHDGAQQRLVSTALNLRLARTRMRSDPRSAERLLVSAGDELDNALDELRELARGIHPAVLTDRGLDTAIETLARRAPLPVELRRLPTERMPEAVELAAYFVVSEALTNVAKYADASHATVNMERRNGRLVVEVADDGVGGANPENGTGLRGLADRLAVIEGRLEVDSQPGEGTRIRAKIPCG